MTACGRLGFDATPDAGPSYVGPWRELGGSATGGGVTDRPPATMQGTLRVAVGADERPIVAWTDSTSGNNEVYLRAWDGSSWVELGGSATGGGLSNDPDDTRAGGIAVAPNGAPCVSWFDDTTLLIRLVCWNGSQWIGLDGSEAGAIQPAGIPWWPSLVFDGDHAVVAWEEYVGPVDAAVYLKRHEMGWSGLGGSATGDGVWPTAGAINVSAAARDRALWLVWQAADGSEVYAAEWTGTAWVDRAGSSTTSISASPGVPSVRAVGALGVAPAVAWIEDADVTEHGRVYLRRLDGASWVELGGSASGAGIPTLPPPAFYPGHAVDRDGEPIVIALLGGDVHATRWDGRAWIDHGNVSATGYASWPELAVSPGGTIYVAWMNRSPAGEQVYLRYLEP